MAGGALVLALLGACTHQALQAPALTTPTPTATDTPTAAPRHRVATPQPTPSRALPRPTTAALRPPTARPAHGRPKGEPTRVVVMSARGDKLVNAALVPTALDTHGVLAPPPGVAGWYNERGWPKPGFPGASILAGHINTRRNGPDTFAHLPQVRAGAVVTVRYTSGDEVDFVVTRSAPVPKKQVPKDDSIWDAANRRPVLRLITCDPTTPVKGGHYVGNWVVWASPPP